MDWRKRSGRGNGELRSARGSVRWRSIRRTGRASASPIGWCPPRQRGAHESRVSYGRRDCGAIRFSDQIENSELVEDLSDSMVWYMVRYIDGDLHLRTEGDLRHGL